MDGSSSSSTRRVETSQRTPSADDPEARSVAVDDPIAEGFRRLGLASAEDRRGFRELATLGQLVRRDMEKTTYTLVTGRSSAPPKGPADA